VGGIALLVWGLRAATVRLADADRTRLLAAALVRFSPLALGSVLALVVTGAFASFVHLESVPDLWETGFGRAITVKIGILAALVGLGALHRRRHIPALERAAEGGESPGSAGLATRRALRAELALFAGVIAASAILVGQTTPDAVSAGPASTTTTIGEAQMDLTVEPALVGSNEVHIYLFDSEDGSQYDALRGVELEATMPEKDIGPLDLDLRKAGPGHYTTSDAALGAPGTWELTFSGRLSRFEEPRAVVEVPIE
jgi:copper transport protein